MNNGASIIKKKQANNKAVGGKAKARSSKSKTKAKGKRCDKIIYFDNNGTTLICPGAKKAYNDWISCYNISTDSKISKNARQAYKEAIDNLLTHCGVSTATHTAVFTSGATESNCFIIRACVKAFRQKLTEKGSDFEFVLPHIVVSAIEHKSIISCVEDLRAVGEIELSYVQPSIYGGISPEDVANAIQPNTCLISIMFANNEIPIVNNIRVIGEIAHKFKVPLHSDCVQIFGKSRINIAEFNIDALSASAHKFYGPKGVGILIINNDLIDGYKLTAEINGTQQGGLRGGTENVPGVISCMAAIKHTFKRRKQKNKKLRLLRDTLLEKLASLYPLVPYEAYLDFDKKERADVEFVSLGPPNKMKPYILPNTVLLSICKNKGKPFCNIDLKHHLDNKNIIISVGSACNTKSKSSSHVLDAIGAPDVIKRGVIRISFNDQNTKKEINTFIDALDIAIKEQTGDLKAATIASYD